MNHELDVSGMKCPLPLMKAKRKLAGIPGGDTLRVIATDPQSIDDFERFCDGHFCTILDLKKDSGKFIFSLRREVSA